MAQDPRMQTILKSLSRRVNRAVWLSRFAPWAAGVLAATAVVMLVLKLTAPTFASYSVILLLGIPAAMYDAFALCRRKGLFFREKEIAEVVDHVTGSDGLVSTSYERPELVGQEQILPEVQRRLAGHVPRLDPRYYGRKLGPAALFLGAALVIPPRPPAPERERQEVLAVVSQPLAEKLQMAAELLPEQEREELEQQLEAIQNSTEGVSREQWEAVEEVQQRIDNAVEQSELAAGQMTSALNQLAGMMGEQPADSTPLGNDAEKQAKMDEIVQDLALRADDKKMPLNEQQRQQLRDAMKQCKNGQCSKKDIENLRKELAGLCDKLGKCKGGDNPGGRGGVGEGGADSSLLLGAEKQLDFEAQQQMVQNQYLTPEDMVDLGVVPVQPKPEPGKFAPGTLQEFGAQQGSNVNRTRISPGQRDVVSKYFEGK